MFSNRLSEPNSAPSWNMIQNSFRTSYSLRPGLLTMSMPLMRMRPCSGLSRPISDLRKTVLPVPDGAEHHADLTGRKGEGDVLYWWDFLGRPSDYYWQVRYFRWCSGHKRSNETIRP